MLLDGESAMRGELPRINSSKLLLPSPSGSELGLASEEVRPRSIRAKVTGEVSSTIWL